MINVSVGIPAHNEERNINLLIQSVLNQKENNFRLKEVVVALDGCTDNTENEIKKIKSKKIKIINDKKRFGKPKRLNQLYEFCTGDILIQIDADVYLLDYFLFARIIEAFKVKKNISVIYGMQMPLQPSTFVGKVALFGFNTWEIVKKLSDKNVERYNCFANLTAYSRNFFKKYRLKEDSYITDDTYSFYYAKKHKYKTYFESSAIVYFKLPSTLRDYSYQMSRYLSTKNEMNEIFGSKLISKYETLNQLDKMKGLLRSITLSNFLIAISYVLLQLVPKIQNALTAQKREWTIIESSK